MKKKTLLMTLSFILCIIVEFSNQKLDILDINLIKDLLDDGMISEAMSDNATDSITDNITDTITDTISDAAGIICDTDIDTVLDESIPSDNDVGVSEENPVIDDMFDFDTDGNIPDATSDNIPTDTSELSEKYNSLDESRMYYYSCLNAKDKKLYRELYAIFKDRLAGSSVSSTDIDKISDFVNFILYDNPDIFYIKASSHFSYIENDDSTEITPSTSMNDSKITAVQTKIDDYVNRFLNTIDENASDYDKAYAAYRYIIENTKYVKGASHNQDIYSVVLGKSVCMGYAHMFKYLCSRMNIPCITVEGDADGPHAWNIAYFNNNWCHIDCTWGDSDKAFESYNNDWFGLSSKIALKERKMNYAKLLPNCTSNDNDYYNIHGMAFNKYNLKKLKNIDHDNNLVCFRIYNEKEYNKAVKKVNTGEFSEILPGFNEYLIGSDTQSIALFSK